MTFSIPGHNHKGGFNLNKFVPELATFPNDRYAGTIRNMLVISKTQARMGHWQMALRNMANHVDALRGNDRPDLIALVCNEMASILVEKGAKVSGLKLRKIAGDIFITPDPYTLNLNKMYEEIIPLVGRGIQENLNKTASEPLHETIDVRQSIMFLPPKSDMPVEVPEFMRESQKALYRIVNEEMGSYQQNTFCLKLDSWDELALAIILGGLENDFPHPQRTVAEKLLKVGDRDQILFCHLETEGKIDPAVTQMLKTYLDSTIPVYPPEKTRTPPKNTDQ